MEIPSGAWLNKGITRKWKCKNWTSGGSSVPSSILYRNSWLVSFHPQNMSSVATESATIQLSYLHLFQIVSFTLNCLCKLMRFLIPKLENWIPSRRGGHPSWNHGIYFHEKGSPSRLRSALPLLPARRHGEGSLLVDTCTVMCLQHCRHKQKMVTSSAGLAPGLWGGVCVWGCSCPSSKVQCKRDVMYMRFWSVLFFFCFCFSFAVIRSCMHGVLVLCHTYTHRRALLPCHV